jgi:hypothetical protein
MSKQLRVSFGVANYRLNALADLRMVGAVKFTQSRNILAHADAFTHADNVEDTVRTGRFFKWKLAEY